MKKFLIALSGIFLVCGLVGSAYAERISSRLGYRMCGSNCPTMKTVYAGTRLGVRPFEYHRDLMKRYGPKCPPYAGKRICNECHAPAGRGRRFFGAPGCLACHGKVWEDRTSCPSPIGSTTTTTSTATSSTSTSTSSSSSTTATTVTTTTTTTGAVSGSFDAPSVLSADASGAFRYNAVFTPTKPVRIATYEFWSVDNTDVGHLVADGFCLPGSPLSDQPTVIPISGKLLDLSKPGTVKVRLTVCPGENYTVTTTIAPPAQGKPITVSPPNPSAADPISLTYSINLPTPCTVMTHEYSISRNTIRLDARWRAVRQPAVFCAQGLDTRSVTETISPPLAAGVYTVNLYEDEVLAGTTYFTVKS